MKTEQKYCIKCAVLKPISEFPAKSSNKDGIDNRCRECEKVRQTEKSRRRRLREEVRVQEREYQRKRSQTPEARAIRKQYLASERGKAVKAANNLKRKAEEAGGVTQRWVKSPCPEHLCYWCGTNLTDPGVEVHREHLMPLSLGGNSAPDNIAPACSTCNLAKSSKHPLVWLAAQFDV